VANFLAVKHNIEVAHRLYDSYSGKCENIHGHSMWVTMHLNTDVGEKGMAKVPGTDTDLEFGEIKRSFRGYLDRNFDHRLVLNASDPFSRPIFQVAPDDESGTDFHLMNDKQVFLPGLNAMPGDPTTENMARWIGEAMVDEGFPVNAIELWETSVNNAMWMPNSVQVIDATTVRLVHQLEQEGRV
jgi:6-pyruvoyl-tetrahydropterin synthase